MCCQALLCIMYIDSVNAHNPKKVGTCYLYFTGEEIEVEKSKLPKVT